MITPRPIRWDYYYKWNLCNNPRNIINNIGNNIILLSSSGVRFMLDRYVLSRCANINIAKNMLMRYFPDARLDVRFTNDDENLICTINTKINVDDALKQMDRFDNEWLASGHYDDKIVFLVIHV